jgi:hypothetical protein
VESVASNASRAASRTPGASSPAAPRFLRVEDAAAILQIGRSAAYEQARRWIATEGRTGLPAVKIGRAIRIPVAALERWAAIGSDEDDIAIAD